MVVKCIKNKISDFINNKKMYNNLIQLYNDIDKIFYIKLEEYYVVYAIEVDNIDYNFFICLDSSDEYPVPYYYSFFEIIDSRFSKYWITDSDSVSWDTTNKKKLISETIVSFPEWKMSNGLFYEQLIDGNAYEVELFKRYKAKMDLEFKNPNITDKVIRLQNNWIQCPICFYVWEETNKGEMVICQNCKKLLLADASSA